MWKVHEQELDAILYSNYSWLAPIKTSVAELRPVDSIGRRVSSYVLRYTNRYEQASPKDPMVLAMSDEAVEQFRLLASFHFQSFFHVDRSYVESLCRTGSSHSSDTTVPSVYVPKFFDSPKNMGTNAEAVGFVPFVEKVLRMPRKQYRLLMSCLAAFFDALEAIGRNFDLAYSMMVYMLEALSKSGEQPRVGWDDYDQNVRGRLDKELASVEVGTAEKVRAILLSNPHLKLKKRFVNFIASHVNDSYFASEAERLRFALAKSDLGHALGNLYDARSGYVHDLKKVQEQLRLRWVGTENDVFHWINEPHITFAGLVRLGRHVLASFIDRQPAVEREEHSWRGELPGQVQMALAPEYWAGRPEGFQPSHARQRFSGFVQHLMTNFPKSQIQLLDLRPLMEQIEKMAPSAQATDRLPMLALYAMFNGMIVEQDRRPNWLGFLSRWDSELQQCCIELLFPHVIFGSQVPWPAEECVAAFEQYQRSKYKAAATSLPRIAEIAVMAEIANFFLDAGQVDRFEEWAERAMLDSAGWKAVQDHLRGCRNNKQRIDVQQLLGRPATVNTRAVSTEPGAAVTEEDIRLRAFFKWEAAGSPFCDGVCFWLEAEKELRPHG